MEPIVQIFKQLGHPVRLRILSVLRRGDLTVSELVTVLGLSQPRVTQYIGSLEDAGLIERRREGSWVFVRLCGGDNMLGRILTAALDGIDGEPALADDRQRLQQVRAARAADAERFFAGVASDAHRLSHDFLASDAVDAALKHAVGPGRFDHAVDLGTGTGRMLALFADRVTRGTGIDRSSDMLRVARHTLGRPDQAHLSVQLGDLTRTELPDDCADLVLIHHVLHYLDDPAAALVEAARLLRPGGRLVVADFAEHDNDMFRDRFAHRRLGFARAEVLALMQASGLSARDCDTVHVDGGPDVRVWTGTSKTSPNRNAA